MENASYRSQVDFQMQSPNQYLMSLGHNHSHGGLTNIINRGKIIPKVHLILKSLKAFCLYQQFYSIFTYLDRFNSPIAKMM